MDPITIAVLLLLGSAAAVVTLAVIEAWIDTNKIPHGAAELVRKKLADGRYEVVVGIFDNRGVQVSSKTWTAKRLDDKLHARFRTEGEVIRVAT